MRTWFSHIPPNRAVRGGHIIDVQLPLARSGLLASVDGIYAGQTSQALRLWQAGKGLTPSGAIDELTWQGLTNTSGPSLFRRCLALTAAFEGHGYTLAVGNFDGAYLTWGIIGFNLKGGNLGEVIKRIRARHPTLLDDAFGSARAQELLEIIDASRDEQRVWADALSEGAKKYFLRQDWRDGFETLGNRGEVRAIQDEVARDVYWTRAIKDLGQYGAMTELDAALFFDTAVQNGGVDKDQGEAIDNALDTQSGLSTKDRLTRIAGAIASKSKAEFRADVLSRRGTIAGGSGGVHGVTYLIESWGLGDFSIAERDIR